MSVSPLTSPDVDTVQPIRVRDLAPAVIDYLRMIRQRQHALMSGWGGAAICRTLYIQATGDATHTVTVRVPPGVTDLDLALLAYGNGTVTITTSVDATGTELRSVAPIDSAAIEEEQAAWVSTGGALSSSAGASSARAVTVASSATWVWQDVDLTLTITGVTSRFGCLALETRPIHAPR